MKRLNTPKLRQRNKVVAVGNPRGIDFVWWKIYCSRKLDLGSCDNLNQGKPIQFKILKIIHHDAAIGSGSSGGPLFDAGGNLIGLNTIGIMEGTTGFQLNFQPYSRCLRD